MELISEYQQMLKESDQSDEIKRYQKKLMHYLEMKKQLAQELGTVVVN